MKSKHFLLKSIGISIIFVAMLSIASCQPKESVRYNASYSPGNTVETITFEAWSLGNLVRQNTAVFYPTPTEGQNEEIPIYVYHGVKSVSMEEAFLSLTTEYDSVRFTRSSDGASTITFRHDDNATEGQRFFFKREAWTCSPDDEGYEGSRTYTLKLTDDMFH